MKKANILFFILFVSCIAFGQSLTGMTGYYNIPSAEIIEDGQISIGASFLNKKYLKYAHGERDVAAIFLTLGYIPNIEISGRFTRQLKYKGDTHNIDRVVSAKIRFVSESTYLPSFAVGLHNPLSTEKAANHFNSTYMVATKNFYLAEGRFLFSISAGQGFDWIKSADHQFIGTFGGALLRYGNDKTNIEFIVENDAERWNGGVRIKLFNLISIMGGIQGFDTFSGNAAFIINL